MGISVLGTAAPSVDRNLRVVADTAERDALGATLGVLGTGVHAYQLSDFQTYAWHGNQWIRLAKGQYGSGAPVEVDTTVGTLGVSDDIARRDHRHQLADSGWVAPALLNGWVNYGAPWATAGYRKIGTMVVLRGLIRSGTLNTVGFVVPAGFRVALNQERHIPTLSNGILGGVRIYNNGDVRIGSEGSTAWFSLDGVYWVAEA